VDASSKGDDYTIRFYEPIKFMTDRSKHMKLLLVITSYLQCNSSGTLVYGNVFAKAQE